MCCVIVSVCACVHEGGWVGLMLSAKHWKRGGTEEGEQEAVLRSVHKRLEASGRPTSPQWTDFKEVCLLCKVVISVLTFLTLKKNKKIK